MLMSPSRYGLHALKREKVAYVVSIREEDDNARDVLRLRELGFCEGVEVELLHQGVFGADPLAVRVGGNLVALRRKHAELVEVSTDIVDLPLAEAAE
jgi:ferrous iron transport protein A